MQLYTNSIQDRYGNALKGAQITVRTDVGDIATLYSDNGVTLANNPLTADDTGEFSFYAANGRYSFTVGAIGMQSEVVSAFEMYDALELQAIAGGSAAEAVANAAQVALDRAAVEASVILADDDRTAAEIAAAQALTRSAAAALSEYNAGLSAAQVATSGTAATLAANLLLPGGGVMVGNTPAGTIAATTVQGAINELDAEKAIAANFTNIDNTSDDNKPVSTAQAAAIALRYGKNNILGTVSQAAGVPTGAVIERGSNANGEYVRFADGTQIFKYPDFTYLTSTTVSKAHPASVVGVPVLMFGIAPVASWDFGAAVYADTNNANFQSSHPAPGANVVHLAAVSRWF